ILRREVATPERNHGRGRLVLAGEGPLEEVAMKRITDLALTLTLAGFPASAAISEPPGLAAAIRATADEEPAFMLTASGAHIYQCKATPNDPNVYAWYFTAPDATLSEGSRTVGTHKVV